MKPVSFLSVIIAASALAFSSASTAQLSEPDAPAAASISDTPASPNLASSPTAPISETSNPPAAVSPVSTAAAPPATLTASASATAAPPATPLPAGFAHFSDINSGDTAWMLTSCALVLLMTMPGLALFYGGMARRKNVINTFMLVFSAATLSAAIWLLFGYSLAFSDGSSILGNLSKAFMSSIGFSKDASSVAVHSLAPNIPESVYAMFQMTFAMITPALIVGAFVERVKFSAAMLFVAAWDILVYAPIAHWVWGPGGWLASAGALDFAGGTVVHIASGTAGLAFAMLAGPRLGYPSSPMPPSNLSLTLAGACLLWVGWFGFNAGSALSAGPVAGSAMLATQISAVFGALTWLAVEWIRKGKPTILGAATGAVAGLVSVTPAAGFIGPDAAILFGLAGGLSSYIGATSLKRAMRIDDSMDAFGVHGVAGFFGTALTGLLASSSMAGSVPAFSAQLLAASAVAAWSLFVSLIILFILRATVGLRVSSRQEEKGLDLSLHGESIDHD